MSRNKHFCGILLLFFILDIFSACSADLPKVDDLTIRRDLTKNDSLLNESIYTFEISTRDTNGENKTEVIEVSVDGYNDKCEYNANYRLHYKHEKGNWNLSSIATISKSIEYLSNDGAASEDSPDYETVMKRWEVDGATVAENVREAFEKMKTEAYESSPETQ